MKRYCAAVVLLIPFIVGCPQLAHELKIAGKKTLPLAITWHWDREDNIFIDDRYRVHLNIYHTAQHSVAGKYVVRAHGDVFGEGGQENGEAADNYDESDFLTFAPGRANGYRVFFYVNDPELASNNLPSEKVKELTNMEFEIEFMPSPDDPTWRLSRKKLVVRNGEGNWVSD
jgi:hypothetical protein